MSILIRKIYLSVAFALLAGFSCFSHATIYYWATSSGGTQYSSPVAACNAIVTGQNSQFTPAAPQQLNNSQWLCKYNYNGGGPYSSSQVNLYGDSCTTGQTFYAGVGTCQVPATCDAGQVASSSTNVCGWPTTCPTGQSLAALKNSSGVVTYSMCVPNADTPNTVCTTYDTLQSGACQQAKANCTSTGGTYGIVDGGTAGLHNVCVPSNYGGASIPNCASGATQFSANSDGSQSPTCVGTSNISGNTSSNQNIAGQPVSAGNDTASTSQAQSSADTANNTAAIAKIDNEGFQAVVNAINNNTTKAGTSSGISSGSTASQDTSNTAAIVNAINANTASEHGAGTCDPHAANYAQCIGQTSQATDPTSATNSAISTGNSSLDTAKQSALDSISGRDAGSDGTTSIVSTIKGYLPSFSSCNDVHLSFPFTSFTVSCSQTSLLREWLGWFLVMITLFSCFTTAFARTA